MVMLTTNDAKITYISNRTTRQLLMTGCWQLVFIHILLFVICLASFSCHFQSAPTIPEVQIYFVLERG